MKASIEFSDLDLQRAFNAMEPKTFKTAVKAGMRRSLNIIKKRAVANYKAAYPGSDRFKKIHAKVYRTGTGAMIDLLFVPGDKRNSIALRAQNVGSVERHTKMGYNRGVMPASNYFTSAIDATMPQAEKELKRNLDESIIKKARKEGLI